MAATNYGTNATLLAATPIAMPGVGEQGGTVRVIYDNYVFTGDLATTNIILMGGKIPAGARVIDAFVKSPDLDSSSASNIDFGWQASDDAVEAADLTGFLNDMDTHTAADVVYASINQAAASGIGKKFAAACQPVITLDGEPTATTGTIHAYIFYVID